MTKLSVLLALSSAMPGCHISRVRKVILTANTVNDDNSLLTVEGKTNLPDGAQIEAILSDSHGRRLDYERGEVRSGRYFAVLDISRAPGFRLLSLDVFFDPLVATAEVQGVVGPRGEAMSGPLVEESHDRQMVLLRQKMILQMNPRQAFLRKLESGDGDMAELESLLARHPDDPEALIGLGLAYLKQRPSERHPNSRAESFLKQGILGHPRSQRLEIQARLWLSRLAAEAKAAADEEARAHQSQPEDPFHRENEIRPGEGLGAFHLGMPSRFVYRHFQLDHEPGNVGPGTKMEIFQLKDVSGVEVGIDGESGNVSLIGTTDPRFKTKDGLGVGSVMDDVRRLVPEANVVYGPQEKHADGRLYSEGTLELNGLTLFFQSSTNPVFPIPVERVIKIQVVPIAAEAAAPASTGETPGITPTVAPPAAGSPAPEASSTPTVENSPGLELVPGP